MAFQSKMRWMRWMCLVHGVLDCRCGSSDVAPWGDGAFTRWCKPRDTDIYVNLTTPPERPGQIWVLRRTAEEPGRTATSRRRAGGRR